MDFIPHPVAIDIALGVACTFLFASLCGLAVGLQSLNISRPSRSRKLFSRWGASILVVSWSVTLVCLAVASGHSEDRWSEFDSQTQESYGITLSEKERRALDYPDAEPESDFKVFGSFERDGEEVFLVWSGGQFELGSFDADAFEPLTK